VINRWKLLRSQLFRILSRCVAVIDDHGLDEEVLAGEEELPARFRSRDRCRRHELRDLPHRVGARLSSWRWSFMLVMLLVSCRLHDEQLGFAG
jgi:hypothetical protein